ncbi:hypothetical protein BT69DRAFT_1221940 [Atractiella rhizophila]|nr:hypothetical protein BT69DRAFT_1221940 [Atractiella rhizophila]
MTVLDPSSYSNQHEIKSTHLAIDWSINWETRIFSGSVVHRLLAVKDGVKEVILDINKLKIDKVTVGGKEAKYEIGESTGMGAPLTISLENELKEGQKEEVKIEYSTSKECAALGWLEPAQTATGTYPFMYSQCQAILARCLVPCQDSPGVKITYTARARSKLPILFSGLRVSPPPTDAPVYGVETEYVYEQPIAIPSYLIAIAGGELGYAATGERTGLWINPKRLEEAKWEFGDYIEKFIKTAESFLTPYVWKSYDLLILPESFPYGGMENPNCTFVTPSLLAGDHSCVDVVAHEISHSWFGNDISCATWEHFWLNEGWTTYTERLIIRAMEGEAARDFSFIVRRAELKDALKRFDNEEERIYQRLVTPVKPGDDPDDWFSVVPYEKGSNFLLYLERKFGFDKWMGYVRHYIETFRGKSIRTEDWKDDLYAYWKKTEGEEGVKKLDEVDWDAWLHGEGEIPVEIKYDTTLADQAYALAAKWNNARSSPDSADFSASDLSHFSSDQKVVFLETLASQDIYPSWAIKKLDELYGLNSTKSAEVRSRWFSVALRANLFKEDGVEWVKTQGRMKFCRRFFSDLAAVDKELAIKSYTAHKEFYHPIARATIERVRAPSLTHSVGQLNDCWSLHDEQMLKI